MAPAVAWGTARRDRAATPVLRTLAEQLGDRLPGPSAIEAMMHPVGDHAVPDAYASSDLLG